MTTRDKRPTVLKTRRLQAEVLRVSLHEEMIPLLQRVRGNKSKRTAKTLVKEGPLRVVMVALDEGGALEEHSVAGPFAVQCLLGRARMKIEGRSEELRPGTMLIVDSGVKHDLEAIEPSVLLLTITTGG